MRVLAEKGTLLVLGMALALLLPPGAQPDGVFVAGLLSAVSAAGLAEWLRADTRWSWLPCLAYPAIAVAAPAWSAFVPLVAYDAARLTGAPRAGKPGRGAARITAPLPFSAGGATPLAWLAAAARWFWALPLAAMWFRAATGGNGLAGYLPVLVLAPVALLGFVLGRARAGVDAARRALLQAQDRARESSRSARSRIADIDEERAQSVRMAPLGERTRIAREIHDNVGHLLTRAIMQAQAGKAVAEATGDAAAARGFAALGGTLDDAMTMVRRSVHDLDDDGTDFVAQIDDAVASFDGISPGFAVTLANDIASAPAPVSRCFATVIREALSNTVHHSAAASASVTLRDFPAFWQLVVQDPGPANDGHARMAGEPTRGMGLADIESRVRALGGTAVCGPYEGGWRVFASVPKRRRTDQPGTPAEPEAAARKSLEPTTHHESRSR